MERLKKWRKGIIILVVIGVLIMARILLFESVWLYSYRSYFSATENYEKYYLLEGKVRKRHGGFLQPKYMQEDEFVLMFQWDYNKLVEEMNQEMHERLDKLVECYEFVSSYEINEQDKIINIYYDKAVEEKKVRGEGYYGLESVVEDDIELFCRLKTSFMKRDARYMIYLRDIGGEYVKKVGRYN